LFIDDSLPNIEAARAHGWRAVHLPQPHALRVKLFGEIGLQAN
jgi:FMN phosphatase YigB (HAD superfamily)